MPSFGQGLPKQPAFGKLKKKLNTASAQLWLQLGNFLLIAGDSCTTKDKVEKCYCSKDDCNGAANISGQWCTLALALVVMAGNRFF